jgi:myo-inositol catabolism protein IolC
VTTLEDISGISDISFLLNLIMVAEKNKDSKTKEAAIARLQQIGVLPEGEGDDNPQKRTLKALVDRIIGT